MWASGTSKGAFPSHLTVSRGDTDAADFLQGDLIADLNFHDLDLSGIIPVGAAFVHITVRLLAGVAGKLFVLREKGCDGGWVDRTMHTQAVSITIEYEKLIRVDSNRYIEYKLGTGAWSEFSITVVGWKMLANA